jgi:N-carbamoyl-L-amino-acid hydrolase
MLGSLVYVGGLSLEEAYASHSADGKVLIDELTKIGYVGQAPLPLCKPHAFVELHIEQGPILDIEGVTIGAVRDLQGISWQELTIVGQSNHAGTTPMRLRHDAGYCAAAISVFIRELTKEMGGAQVATMGATKLHPNLINVIAARAVVTVDLRNTDEALLKIAEQKLNAFLTKLSNEEGVTITSHRLARFEPVKFDQSIADLIASKAQTLGYSCRTMTSGAGHDAQMMARFCPSAMIFVPSVKGISHNPAEHTEVADLVAGGNVLLQTLLELAR